MNTTSKTPTWKAIAGAVSAIAILIVSQIIAMLVGSGFIAIGMPDSVWNIVSAILYPMFALLSLKLLCGKLLGITLTDCRITKYRVKPVWAIAAFIMPAMAVFGLLMTSGHWDNHEMDGLQIADSVTTSIFVVGLAVVLFDKQNTKNPAFRYQ